jgi:hypothetical protein
MDLGFLGLGLFPQLAELVALLLDLDVVTKEKGQGEKGKPEKVGNNPYGLARYSEMSALGGVMTEDKNRIAFLLHNVLLVSTRME